MMSWVMSRATLSAAFSGRKMACVVLGSRSGPVTRPLRCPDSLRETTPAGCGPLRFTMSNRLAAGVVPHAVR